MEKTTQLKLIERIVDHMDSVHHRNRLGSCPGCLEATHGLNKQSECDCGGIIHNVYEPNADGAGRIYELCDKCTLDYFKKVIH